ncbi:tetratricopeptide repeat protein [Amycolatopsis solani]|uniref:tetratricopeptide repeat protein n=1 Tax=Amycolatopsis solani TaxID=3028615 RepID=UPI00296E6DE5|nr:tetratricopeptide repeat protein [Amycolatopsis sp. MEP2-6]
MVEAKDGGGQRGSSRNEVADGVFHGPVVQIGNLFGPAHVGSQRTTPLPLQDSQYWPVAAAWDPVAAGVHRARPQADDQGVPPYVERDIDTELRRRLDAVAEAGGLVLLLGHSAAGKTRAAFEAMRAVMPNRRVATPSQGSELQGVLATIIESPEQCVVWLDNLELFLGPGALDVAMLAAFQKRNVPLLATMRMREYKTFHPMFQDVLPTDADSVPLQEAQIGARVLASADPLEVQRIWSDDEIARAARFDDDRISAAVEHSRHHGVAEYLAAGPAIWSAWRMAMDVDGQPRAAALIAAAVDLARAGLAGPYDEELIVELHEHYLERQGGLLLRPESLVEAWAWASQQFHGVTSPLFEVAGGQWSVFDYLVDRLERMSASQPVLDATWLAAKKNSSGKDLLDIALRAADAGTGVSTEVAESIWRWMLDADVETSMACYNLGVLCNENGRMEESIAYFSQAAKAGEPRAAFNLAVIYDREGKSKKSRKWRMRAADANYPPAFFLVGFDLEEQGKLDEAEQWYRRGAELNEHRSATNLGKLLSETGRAQEALPWFHKAEEDGDPFATYNIGLFHHGAGRREQAEEWYGKASARGSAEAALNLGTLRLEAEDYAGARKWYERAFELGLFSAAGNLGKLLDKSNDADGAESWFRRGAEVGDRSSAYALGAILYKGGRLEEALDLLGPLVSADDNVGQAALAEILDELGRTEEAIPYWQTAAEAGNVSAAFNLGVIFAKRRDLQQAKRWYQTAAEAGDAEAAINLADVLFTQGRLASASWWIDKARSIRAGLAAGVAEPEAVGT